MHMVFQCIAYTQAAHAAGMYMVIRLADAAPSVVCAQVG